MCPLDWIGLGLTNTFFYQSQRTFFFFFFWFCRTWTKRYLITSQTRVKRVSRIHHRTILWCIRLTRLTLVCEVIRYRLVQVRRNQKKTFRVGGPQSPFSISSSFILSFVLLAFFLNTKTKELCCGYVQVGERIEIQKITCPYGRHIVVTELPAKTAHNHCQPLGQGFCMAMT